MPKQPTDASTSLDATSSSGNATAVSDVTKGMTGVSDDSDASTEASGRSSPPTSVGSDDEETVVEKAKGVRFQRLSGNDVERSDAADGDTTDDTKVTGTTAKSEADLTTSGDTIPPERLFVFATVDGETVIVKYKPEDEEAKADAAWGLLSAAPLAIKLASELPNANVPWVAAATGVQDLTFGAAQAGWQNATKAVSYGRQGAEWMTQSGRSYADTASRYTGVATSRVADLWNQFDRKSAWDALSSAANSKYGWIAGATAAAAAAGYAGVRWWNQPTKVDKGKGIATNVEDGAEAAPSEAPKKATGDAASAAQSGTTARVRTGWLW